MKNSRTKNSSRLFIESGTDELNRRHSVVIDDLDHRGIFQRARVEDQREIDRLFVRRSISAPHHGAAEMFLDACEASGMAPRSCSLEAAPSSPLHKVGTVLAMRRLAFSGAYRSMGKASEEGARSVLHIVVSNARIPISVYVISALDALVQWYGTGGIEDPRQIDFRTKKKEA
jgi:hypothetical protein